MNYVIRKQKRSALKWVLISASAFALIMLFFTALIIMAINGFGSGNTAHIKVRGVITSGESFPLGAEVSSSEDVVAAIEKAEADGNIKAILLDINSPGGSAVASEEVATAVRNAEKPVVALIRDVGASGAYWAASSSDAIVASPLSIVGSVGATASYLEFSGLMGKYGVVYERLVSGEFKDSGTAFRDLSDEEKEMIQEMIDSTGGYFAQSVKESRGLSDETMEEVSSGRTYIGLQAKSLNLVDELGNIETAKESIRKLSGVESVELVEYRTKKPLGIASILAQQASFASRSMGAALLPDESMISLK